MHLIIGTLSETNVPTGRHKKISDRPRWIMTAHLSIVQASNDTFLFNLFKLESNWGNPFQTPRSTTQSSTIHCSLTNVCSTIQLRYCATRYDNHRRSTHDRLHDRLKLAEHPENTHTSARSVTGDTACDKTIQGHTKRRPTLIDTVGCRLKKFSQIWSVKVPAHVPWSNGARCSHNSAIWFSM